MSKTDIDAPRYEMKKVSDLKNWKENPRTITGAEFQRLKDQIHRLGVYKPLLINQNNFVLGGNMRLKALKEMGIEEVMCSIVLTDNNAQMIEYALSDNDQMGETDQQKLAQLVTLNPIKSELFAIHHGVLKPLNTMMQNYGGTDEVNAGDETSEWVGMPGFEPKDDTFKLIIHFEDHNTRDQFVAERELQINTRGERTFITTYPFKEKTSYKDMKYEEKE